MKNDIYIHLLQEAKKELSERPDGITLDEFKARVKPYGLQIDKVKLFSDIYNSGISATKERSYHMCFDAYMRLLEYEELRHSLEESKQARKEARYAMYFAAGAIIVQVLLWGVDKIIANCFNPYLK